MHALDFSHFHFGGDRELNALYLTLGLVNLGASLVSVFVPVYLWEVSGSFLLIAIFYLMYSVYFVAAGFSFLPLLRRMSDKTMMLLGIPALIAYFYWLQFIDDIGLGLFFVPLLGAIYSLFFNVGYHSDFAAVMKKDHVGEEFGVRQMVVALAVLVGPFVGGFLIEWYGFPMAFTVGGAILIFAVIPLFLFSRRPVAATVNARTLLKYLTSPSLRFFNLAGIGYAIEHSIGALIWPVLLFLVVGGYGKLGAVVSIGFFVAAILNVFIGRISDHGKRRTILAVSSINMCVLWLVRLIAPFVSIAALVLHFAGKVIYPPLVLSWMSQYYKLAHEVKDPGSFILSREMLYHLARIPFWGIMVFVVMTVEGNAIWLITFSIASAASLMFLFANKMHERDLFDGFLAKQTF